MKKLHAILLVVLMMFVLVACGGNTDENTDTNVDNKISNVNDTSTNDNNEELDSDDEAKITFSNSYKVPGKNIVIDVPDYQEMEKGFSQLYILNGEKYVAVTAAKNSSATDLTTAHNDAFEKFKENIQNYSYVNSLNVKEEKTETINGVEVYRYEGTMNCGKDTVYDAYAVGYSFIMDGVPCTITGSVINQEQSQEMIDEIRDTVDAMIKTLRSER